MKNFTLGREGPRREALPEPFKARLRKFRDAEILVSSESILALRGCLNFTVDEVADLVGIAKGTLYSHFPSRKALVEATIERAAERTCAFLSGLLQSEEIEVGAVIRRFVRATLQASPQECPEASRPQLVYPCCFALTQCPFEHCDRATPLIAAALAEAHREGRIDGVCRDPDALARWMKLVLGQLVREAVHPRADDRFQMMEDLIEKVLSPPTG